MNKGKGKIEKTITAFSFGMNKLRNIKVDFSEMFSKRAHKALGDNKKFKDKHKGESCFILGNGPSLNEYDLTRLSGKHTFCVNNMIRIDGIKDICPEYYVLADPIWFAKDINIKSDRLFIDGINNLVKLNPSCNLFVPYNEMSKINYYGWDKQLNVNYYFTGKNFEASSTERHDITKAIPSVNSVILYSILIALYMGFKKIYLIGCEETGIFGDLQAYMDDNKGAEYAFTLSEDERKKLVEYKENIEMGVTDYLRDTARIFEMYDMMYLYCKSCGCKVFTCSSKTLIRSIPFMAYNEMLSK